MLVLSLSKIQDCFRFTTEQKHYSKFDCFLPVSSVAREEAVFVMNIQGFPDGITLSVVKVKYQPTHMNFISTTRLL